MLQFTDKDKNHVLTVDYSTGITKQMKVVITYKILYVSPEFNGEYLYLSEDELQNPVLLFKIKKDFEEFDLFKIVNTPEEAYTEIGKFIETIKSTVLLYNTKTLREVKNLTKTASKINLGD